VLLVLVSPFAGAVFLMTLGGWFGKSYGHQMGDGILALYGGGCFGLVAGLVFGIVGVRQLENRGRLVAIAAAVALAVVSIVAFAVLLSSAADR
jgi:hypothetical protein